MYFLTYLLLHVYPSPIHVSLHRFAGLCSSHCHDMFPSLVTLTQETARVSAASGQISQRAYAHNYCTHSKYILFLSCFFYVSFSYCQRSLFIPSYYNWFSAIESHIFHVYCQVGLVKGSINHWNLDGVDKVTFPWYLGGRSVTVGPKLEEHIFSGKRRSNVSVELCVCQPLRWLLCFSTIFLNSERLEPGASLRGRSGSSRHNGSRDCPCSTSKLQ